MQNLAPELEHPRRPEVENEDREMPDLDPAYAFRITSRIMRHLNKNYFRSRFVGFEQPIRGKHPGAPVIYASNHSGMAFLGTEWPSRPASLSEAAISSKMRCALSHHLFSPNTEQ